MLGREMQKPKRFGDIASAKWRGHLDIMVEILHCCCYFQPSIDDWDKGVRLYLSNPRHGCAGKRRSKCGISLPERLSAAVRVG